jgi:hypothetical protein
LLTDVFNRFSRLYLSIDYLYTLDQIKESIDKAKLLGAMPLIGPENYSELLATVNSWLKPNIVVFNLTLGVDDEFFYPLDLDNFFNPVLAEDNLNDWRESVLKWIRGSFDPSGVATLYLPPLLSPTEKRLPKILCWLNEKNVLATKTSASHIWPYFLRQYGQAVESLGLNLKPKKSNPTSDEIAKYYRTTQDATACRALTTDELKQFVCCPKDLPTDNSLASLNRYALDSILMSFEKARPYLEDLDFQRRALTIERERIKNQVYDHKKYVITQAKATAGRNSQTTSFLGPPPGQVLSLIFKAKIEPDPASPKNALVPPFKTYRLLDGSQIFVNGEDFWELAEPDSESSSGPKKPKSGSGALSLIMALTGLDLEMAQAHLEKFFSLGQTLAAVRYHLALTAKDYLKADKNVAFEPIPTTEETWPKVKRYLEIVFSLPASVLNKAHATETLLSTQKSLIVFRRASKLGDFFIWPQPLTENPPEFIDLTPLSDPLIFEGPSSPIFLTDHPLEGLALKAFFPQCPVMVVSPELPAAKVSSILAGRPALIATRVGRQGRLLGRSLKNLNLQELKAPLGDFWLAFWRQSQTQDLSQTHPKVLADLKTVRLSRPGSFL